MEVLLRRKIMAEMLCNQPACSPTPSLASPAHAPLGSRCISAVQMRSLGLRCQLSSAHATIAMDVLQAQALHGSTRL